MSLLLHVCCAPCMLYPIKVLKEDGVNFTVYFHNPNIHPFREFKKRLDAVQTLANDRNIQLIIDKDYGLREFLRAVVFNEQRRCSICYRQRLVKTAQMAGVEGFKSFSSTLLYSRYQNHALIVDQAKFISKDTNISFLYRDFRDGWQKGIDESLTLGIYRQSYCGCIYSEQERYDNRFKKKLRKEKIKNV